MHEFVMETIEKTLKDWGILLMLGKDDFKNLITKIEIELGTVID